MKKQYKNPQVKVVNINPSHIICTSPTFGDGDTNVMHAKGRRLLQDEEDDL